ncbi:LuxR family transcriptional regulator [Streptomyces sp. H10-C2]|uniref:helix-turn-helix transcriptional regulator n=1 Tax=unclassified Streptomyces TaxID=2593676 RepID=UPI0024BA030A|nr:MULTISPECIES: LuxR family transcriptional regulator [unclassified Streptomyces]MDJ0346930.1 LuxR family transcriptional regulator [Streptomyces sp. PH10-H1]MDJ0374326.1 LuxR family transcriptional regulator [Streptomyces sp. H10-C2]
MELALLEARALIDTTVSTHRSMFAQQPPVLMRSDRRSIVKAVEQAIDGARHSVNVALSGSGEKATTAFAVIARRRGSGDHDDGVPVRILCSPQALDLSAVRTLARRSSGCEVRVVEGDLHGALIVDGRIVLVQSGRDQSGEDAALLADPAAAKAMELLFAGAWGSALPLTEYLRLNKRLRTESARQILDRLCTGRPDAVAAREMDVSLRTYRRHVARIMDDLGANSRFQAGVRAVELGLLSA